MHPGHRITPPGSTIPRAVPLTGAAGDGKADDSAAIQAAIDKAAADREEGIVFIPEGRYRLTRTIYVWPGGAGDRLARNGRSSCWATTRRAFPQGVADMVIFAGFRLAPAPARGPSDPVSVPFPPPGSVPPNPDIADANPGTFYSAMSNIDFEIGKGNAGRGRRSASTGAA